MFNDQNKILSIGGIIMIFLLGALLVSNFSIISGIKSLSTSKKVGTQTATSGICSGNEPVNTLCNENINNLTVNTAFDTAGTSTLSGDLLAYNLIEGGNVGTITQTGTTTTATAAQFCDNNLINLTVTNATGTNTTLLPTAASLIANCLTVTGQTKQVIVRNLTAATSTTLTTNTGLTLFKNGSTGGTVAMAATSTAIINLIRTGASAVEADINYFIAN